ncbi:MAG: EF-hand domain-containing protein [Planctomycetota bacterium]|nr:EF-hand domain-containing protein [Planctomycetota bacterium]
MKKIVYAAIGFFLLTGTVLADSENEATFKIMDTDEDGKVTLEEFQAFYKEVFKKKDKNGDGVLDEEEFANPDAFEFTDKNKDGKIDPAEDEALRAHHFKKLDQNGDQHLTLDEWVE